MRAFLYWLPNRLQTRFQSRGLRFPRLYKGIWKKIEAYWRRILSVRPPVCEDLKVWSENQNGAAPILLTAERTVHRKMPRTLEPEILNSIALRAIAQIPDRYLYTLHDAKLMGSAGLVILPDNHFVAESVYSIEFLTAEPEYSMPPRRKPEQKKGTYFSLLGKFSNTTNYFHWMHDGLFRLYGLDEHLRKNITFIVPDRLLPHQIETLELLEMGDRYVRFPKGAVWELETLYFASLPPSGRDLPEMARWYRDRMLNAAQAPQRAATKRLYLSRRFDKYGRVTNEDEIMEFLAPLGFELVTPAKLTVREQVILFSQAEVIISSTSSGLANLVFAPDTVQVLELFEPRWAEKQAYVLWSMCDAMNMTYWYLVGESVNNPQHADRADLYVPLNKLARTLQEMQLA